jgi:hypothetical protein
MAGRRSGHPDRAASQLPAQSRSPQKCGGDGRENKVRIQEKPKWLLKK